MALSISEYHFQVLFTSGDGFPEVRSETVLNEMAGHREWAAAFSDSMIWPIQGRAPRMAPAFYGNRRFSKQHERF
ncbi:MAG: hypothetical protein A2W80_14925 [Candidatus Riflebacteria bacterium GWC2_50_8]|nr:MAG: hypothetical protein A2W80_14925 [Candidatus Riflebacteria bacterium GWC2_50_8]